MQIEKKEDYTLIKIQENSFNEFYNELSKEISSLEKEHVFVQLSNILNINSAYISLLLNITTQKKENGTSFVIINNQVNIDDFPENLNIVPTLQEAEDVLEMENIERELGF